MSGRFDSEHKYAYLHIDASQEAHSIENSAVNFDYSGDLSSLARVLAYHSEVEPELERVVVYTLVYMLYNRNLIGEVEVEEMIEEYSEGMLDLYEILGSN